LEEQILFPDRDDFRKWLVENHVKNNGIWVIFSKTKNIPSVKAEEALEEALCFGWIDGQIDSIDDKKYIKKFTPRRKGSRWSAKNRETTARLIKDGRMTDSGMDAIEHAKKNGNWEIAESAPVTEDQITILIDAINGVQPALSNFLKMPLSVRKTYTTAYLDAKKEETRVRRLQNIIERLNENKKPM